jgi:hypothetical protein
MRTIVKINIILLIVKFESVKVVKRKLQVKSRETII